MLPPKPRLRRGEESMPLLPDDLGELSDDALMELFNKLTQWCGYIATNVTMLEVAEDDAQARLKMSESMFIVRNVGPGEPGIMRAQRERDLDPEVMRLRNEVLYCHAKVKITSTLFENTERSIALISRELSRRIGLAPAQGRTAWQRA